jgi:ABC-type phosphate transport system substrate-binding protein
VYKDLSNLKTDAEAKALVGFLNWAIGGGQKFANEMDYAPLSSGVKKAVDAALSSLSHNGKPIK